MKRKSKFDPYINDIIYYLNLGYPVIRVAEQLDQYFDDIVDMSALYTFIRSRALKNTSVRKYRVPHCDNCEDCHEVINTNDEGIRMCYYCRLIPNSVITAPLWCPKRTKVERVS
ncbi:hypothetical protein I5677_12250 [Mobilitalea sibirica]|uniref:Uncharacterized protein n=1 Tax=Mobilitalea sibirica TaxID=1462919 RepID=A0A8J7KWR5_9FIRM|nr:hypothetical protein [Mobilitalea sibirica]MBH1941665.1 hypothetical protein [Mobilitalea sibirica]